MHRQVLHFLDQLRNEGRLQVVQQHLGAAAVELLELFLERLRREVTKLKAERDILKKAAAYFAKESI